MKLRHTLTIVAAVAGLSACKTTETDQDLFLKADTNKDGKLSLAEVNRLGFPRLFGRFDRDGNGSVTLADVRVVEPGFKETEFVRRDLNKDGRVTFAEYRVVAERDGDIKVAFEKVDLNKDGQICRIEAEKYTAKLDKEQD